MFSTHATIIVFLPRLIRRSAVSMAIYLPSPSVNQVSSNCYAGSLICVLCFDLALCTVPHMLFLRNIANTTLPSGTTFDSGSSFSYTCMQDYQPAVESASVQCDKHGQLSHEAQCTPISCKQHPPTIDNGRTIFHSTKHGSIAKYRCLPGYQMENNLLTKATCQFGQWLPKQPSKCLPSETANLCPLRSKIEFNAHSQGDERDKMLECATASWRWEILESPAGQLSHYHICMMNILSFFFVANIYRYETSHDKQCRGCGQLRRIPRLGMIDSSLASEENRHEKFDVDRALVWSERQLRSDTDHLSHEPTKLPAVVHFFWSFEGGIG